MSRSRLAWVAAAVAAVGPALAADPPSAVGPDGKPVPLVRADDKATVVVFLGFDCPVSASYAEPLTRLAAEHAGRGVRVVGVVPGESADYAARRAAEFKIGFPVLGDPDYNAAAALKATTVPEAFVLDPAGGVRYRGRVDDAYSARLKRNREVTSHDLRDAVAAVLAGGPVRAAVTAPVGCPIGFPGPARRAGGASPPGVVTFHRDVLPVLQAHCQGCHRPGQVGPFPLLTYKQAAAWAADMAAFASDGRMPPWRPVGGPGYKNDRHMPRAAVDVLVAWAEAGSPEGDPADAPPPAEFPTDGWELGEPDLVLAVPADVHVGPTGRDLFRCVPIPTGLTEDRYVVGYEVKPGNPRVVHHALNFWDRTGKARELAAAAEGKADPAAADRGPGYPVGMGLGFAPAKPADRPDVPAIGTMGGWAPGMRATRVPDGAGFLLPEGADFVLQVHYHRTGKPEVDRTRVGLYFAKKPVDRPWQTAAVSGLSPFAWIPAGTKDFKATGSAWLLSDAVIYNVMPHMHLIGRSIKATVTLPGQEPRVLVDIPDWDYNWQETYWLKDPIHAPAGTRLDVEAVYDNSADNPHNPSSPPKSVFFGEQTTNEMLFAFVGMTPAGKDRVRVTRLPPDVRDRLEKIRPRPRAKPGRNPAADIRPKARAAEPARIEVPYRLTDTNHVLVRAKLNGRGPFNFILDTGAPIVVAGKAVGQALGKSGDGPYVADDVRIDLEGGGVSATLPVRVDDLYQTQGINALGLAGVELHGVLGYSFLAKYRITYDFTAPKLAFEPLAYDPPAVATRADGGQGPFEAVGPLAKLFAGVLGIRPNPAVVPRGRLGVEVADRDGGVLVTRVLAGSAADKAGLKAGDRLTAVGGEAVSSAAGLRAELAGRKAGDVVTLTRSRAGGESAVDATLDEGI